MILSMQGIVVFHAKFKCGQQVKSYVRRRKSVGIVIFCYKTGRDINQLKVARMLIFGAKISKSCLTFFS